uniref:ribosomal protein L35 n=1 Tax=Grateloupia asiatica TaxID=151735 RepID=UPI002A8046A7|nr:ribosomal protein L35 [Grateloupia asiatica]WOL36890.1 ribosomal protein L35 [Grateloupia asiatica]
MYKLKTSRSIIKRFKLTSSGKLLRHRASRNHLLQKKSTKRKQKLRQTVIVNKSDISNFKSKLFYFD